MGSLKRSLLANISTFERNWRCFFVCLIHTNSEVYGDRQLIVPHKVTCFKFWKILFSEILVIEVELTLREWSGNGLNSLYSKMIYRIIGSLIVVIGIKKLRRDFFLEL